MNGVNNLNQNQTSSQNNQTGRPGQFNMPIPAAIPTPPMIFPGPPVLIPPLMMPPVLLGPVMVPPLMSPPAMVPLPPMMMAAPVMVMPNQPGANKSATNQQAIYQGADLSPVNIPGSSPNF